MKVRNLFRILCRFMRAREAVSAMEYALVVGIVVAGVGGAVWAFTGDVETAIATIGTKVEQTATTAQSGSLAQLTT